MKKVLFAFLLMTAFAFNASANNSVFKDLKPLLSFGNIETISSKKIVTVEFTTTSLPIYNGNQVVDYITVTVCATDVTAFIAGFWK